MPKVMAIGPKIKRATSIQVARFLLHLKATRANHVANQEANFSLNMFLAKPARRPATSACRFDKRGYLFFTAFRLRRKPQSPSKAPKPKTAIDPGSGTAPLFPPFELTWKSAA